MNATLEVLCPVLLAAVAELPIIVLIVALHA
jgi:hypothetical protein